jgi:hypothetical protein
MRGNTFIGPVEGVDAVDYPDNVYLDAPPAANHVVLRPNRFEPGRAHVIVYNWEGADSVSVDLTDVVPTGTDFELRNVQSYFEAPVVSGTYDGGAVTVPLTGLDVAVPIGDPDAIPAEQRTGSDFNVFVLRSAVCQ